MIGKTIFTTEARRKPGGKNLPLICTDTLIRKSGLKRVSRELPDAVCEAAGVVGILPLARTPSSSVPGQNDKEWMEDPDDRKKPIFTTESA